MPSDPRIGSRVARYILRRPLGKGGMGVVYAAYDPELDREVAIKLLHEQGVDVGGSEAEMRLLHEARALARLSHPNVVAVYEVGTHEDELYIAMELVEGYSLIDWAFHTARPWKEVLAVYMQAGRGLAAAHDAGIIHRDFKPGNVLLGADRRARVVDFGLALPGGYEPEQLNDDTQLQEAALQDRDTAPLATSGARITATGIVMGTPAYMAPEMHDGTPADPRSDQFAYCVALYEGLFAMLPFEGKTAFAIADNMHAGRIRDPGRSRVPRWLHHILVRGLNPDPAQRHDSMRSLLASIAFTARIIPG